MHSRLRPAFFDALDDRDPDPWNFASSPYEAAKDDYDRGARRAPVLTGLEVGCSIGVLTVAVVSPR